MKSFVFNRDDVNELRSYASILLDGVKRWDYIELPWKANVPNQSCIPGNIDYLADLMFSDDHGSARYCYRNVDGRTACEIHSANIPAQLKGCGAPGKSRAAMMVVPKPDGTNYPPQDGVTDSREALLEFMTECGIPDFLELDSPEKVTAFLAEHPECATIAIRLNDPSTGAFA